MLKSKHYGLNTNKRGALTQANMERFKRSFQTESIERERNSEFIKPPDFRSKSQQELYGVLDRAEEQREFINSKIEQVKDGQQKLSDMMKLF